MLTGVGWCGATHKLCWAQYELNSDHTRQRRTLLERRPSTVGLMFVYYNNYYYARADI